VRAAHAPWILALALFGCTEELAPPGLFPKLTTNPPIADGEFVRAEGTTFVIGAEQPFRFVGANAAMIHGEKMREGMDALLDAMRDDGLSVIRVWAAGEADDDGNAWRRAYAFRLGPDVWVESSFEHLDQLLISARERNIRVMITLLNRWGDYGGLPQYGRWVGLPTRRKNPLPAELLTLLASEEVRDLYRAHVDRVVSRVNSISGVAYRDDPTIFSWELANELSPQSCEAEEALFDWTRTMARYVRSLDDNHLIGAGHIGYKTTISRRSWQRVTELPEIGYADVHAYPHNVLAVTDPDTLGGWLDERANLALNVIDKPLVLGEIGFRRNDEAFSPREQWFAQSLERADADGLSGFMIWIYRSWDEREDRQGVWAEGPLAEESVPVRRALRWAAVNWAGTAPEITNPAVRDAAPDAELFVLGIRHLRPWTEGEWEADGDDEGRLRIDPWALAEGCASSEEPATLEYVAGLPRDDEPEELVVENLGPTPDDPTTDHAIEVVIDDITVGTWARPGRYSSVEGDALGDAFATRRRWRYLTLRSTSDAGRAHLRRMLTARPVEGTHDLRVRWPARTDDAND